MLCCIEYLYFPKVIKYQLETGQKKQSLKLKVLGMRLCQYYIVQCAQIRVSELWDSAVGPARPKQSSCVPSVAHTSRRDPARPPSRRSW